MYAWFLLIHEKSATISYDILCEIAKRFFKLKSTKRFKCEKTTILKRLGSWIQKRHGIRGFTRHGEAASADVSIVTQILIGKNKDKVATFDPADVFNMDETGWFFRFI